jgi:predicted metal-dependent hydrolase
MSDLVHRQPNIDFAGVPPRWTRNIEFASLFTAGSAGAPAVEPYLNQVMAAAKPMLKPKDRHLADEIDLFIKQETTHYKVHNAYNAEIRKEYPFLKAAEAAKRADYKEFLASKSHKFNCAYAAAFETLALSMALFLFEKADDLIADADPRTLAMWRWHLGEEYEHRSVCHDVYCAIYGDYFFRAKMVIFTYRHLAAHNRRIMGQLLQQERAGMTLEELEQSMARQQDFMKRFKAFHLPRIGKLLLPGYNPGKAQAPKGLESALAAFA